MLRRLVFSILLLLIGGLLAAGWYAYHRGFTHKWRQFVIHEFRKRGVELTMRRLTLDPFRGIVAKEVKVYETRDRKRTRALIDEVHLVINYANLFQSKPFIDALDLHEATLAGSLDPSRPEQTRVVISHLSGRLFLPPQQVYLSHLEAELAGVRITASGRLINPQAYAAADNRANPRKNTLALLGEPILAVLHACHFEDAPPQVDLRFSGDLAHPEQIFAEATLWAQKIRRGNYRVEEIYANVGFRDGLLKVRQLTAKDARGTFRGSGQYDWASGEASAQGHSELDIQGLSAAAWPLPGLSEAVFYAPAKIDLSLRASLGPEVSYQALGRIELRKFAYKSEIFEGFSADFSSDGQRWAARDVRLAHRSGEITGHLLQLPDGLRSDLKSTLSPKVLPPILSGKAAEWFAQFDFMQVAAQNPDLPAPLSVSTALPAHRAPRETAPIRP